MSNETNFPNNSNHPQSANIPVQSLTPFTRFCCSLGMIPSSYKASMSYEEQLMWLCNYLENTVIPTVNNNTDVTNEVQDLFNELHDYVEHYFDNLDVQQEINNKLDTMASDGTLISIIAPYLQPFIDEQNNYITQHIDAQNQRISNVENLVNASTNINPLVANSISDMTDTSRIYVLSTDGNWYFYNGNAWTAGGIYQSRAIGINTVEFNNFTDKTTKDLYYKVTDVSKLYTLSLGTGNLANLTTPALFKKGSTIIMSSSFLDNYVWRIQRINPTGDPVSINQFNSEASYTFENDEYASISWRPIDNNWDTTDYQVNRYHQLDNNDVTSIEFYFINKNHLNMNLIDVNPIILSNTSSKKWFNSTLKMLVYANGRLGTNCFKSSYKTKITAKNGYSFRVVQWRNYDTSPANFISETSWITEYTVPKNTFVTIDLKKDDNTTFDNNENIFDFLILNQFSDLEQALLPNTIQLNNFTDKTTKDLYYKVTDVSKLYTLTLGAGNLANLTTPALFKKGTTITMSSSFLENYVWRIQRINPTGDPVSIIQFNSEASYTFENDEFASISWRPIDNNWDTTDYQVNRFHQLDNNDVTSIEFYFINKNHLNMNLIDVNPIILSNTSSKKGYNSSIKMLIYSNTRLGTNCFKSSYKTKITVKNGYTFRVVQWRNYATSPANFISETNWITEYTVPKNTFVTIDLKKDDNTTFDNNENIFDFLILNQFSDLEQGLYGDYNYIGQELNFKRHSFDVKALMDISYIQDQATQGFCIYENYLIQLFGDGHHIQIFDLTTKTLLYTLYCEGTYNHGDSCQVSNTKYDENDLLPLIYITSNTDTVPQFSILRIQNGTTASIIKSYQFTIEECGYYADFCFDFINKIVFSRGYKLNSYTDETNNSMVCSTFKLDSEIEDNGTFTLQMIETHEEAFVYTSQGCVYFNGFIYIASGFYDTPITSKIYVIDPYKHIFQAIISDLPDEIKNREPEGVAFWFNDNEWHMIVSTRYKYYMLTFY